MSKWFIEGSILSIHQFVSQGYLVQWQGYDISLLAIVVLADLTVRIPRTKYSALWTQAQDSDQGLKVIIVALNSGHRTDPWSCDWDSQVLKVSSLVTNSLVTDWVQFESWPSVAYITLALKFLKSYSSEFLAQCHLTLSNQDLWHQVPPSCHPWCKPFPLDSLVILDLHTSKIYTPESQLPIVLNISLPPGLILSRPRSSYARVPASCHPWCKPSPWDSSMGWGRCHKPCPSAIPNTECPRPIQLTSESGPNVYPQQWSNPDCCYLEPASRVKPEQPHQMAVSTNR